MAPHRLDRRFRVELAKQDGRCAEQRRGEVLGPEAEAEGGWQGAQEDLVVRKLPHVRGEAVKVEPAKLVVEDDLRKTGRAGGRVVEAVDVRGESAPFECRLRHQLGDCAADRDLVVDEGVPADEHVRVEGDALCAEVGDHLPSVDAAHARGAHEGACARESQEMNQLALTTARAEAQARESGALGRLERDVEAGAVG